MNRYKISHPDAECLLQYADGELPSRQAVHVRAHLEACWRCRAELEDVQETITEYVRYEQTVFDSPPDPPVPWNGFGTRLERLIAERQNRWSHRGIALVKAILPNRRILATALAVTIVVFFAFVELRHPPAVNAAELLKRASEQEVKAVHHPRLRIKTKQHTFVRTGIVAANRSPEAEAERQLGSLFVEASYSWDNPLSATSFAAWRDGLRDWHDEVVLQGTGDASIYQIRSSTRSSTLEEATLNLRARDLVVESGTFRFRSREWVEMTALADEPEQAAAPRPATALTRAPDRQPLLQPSRATEELRVIAALHSADADLGDQIELNRDDAGKLIVTATAVAPERRAALQSSLSSLPGISLRFRDPKIDLSRPNEPQDIEGRSSTVETTDGLQLKLQLTLGGAVGLARFTDRVLEASEAAMVQVHDLRKLAKRFSPDVELHFDRNNRTVLERLRHDHAQALATKTADLRDLLLPVLLSLGAADSEAVEQPPTPPSWQDATEILFAAAQRLDQNLTRLFAGAGGDRPAEVATQAERALKQLNVTVGWYEHRY